MLNLANVSSIIAALPRAHNVIAKGPGFSSAAEEASQWRRSGPLPSSEGQGARRGDRPGYNRFESSGNGFDSMEVGTGGRSGFGSRFTPSAPREQRHAENLEPSAGDTASDWRTGKPQAESPSFARKSSTGFASDGPRQSRRGDANDVDERFASQDRLGFGSKFVATPPDSPSVSKRPGFGFDRRGNSAQGSASPGEGADSWRSSRRPSEQDTSSPGTEPAQRKKLDLKPRSQVADTANASSAGDASSTSKSNPFGGAKPVDATERQRQIEEKMLQREKERKEEEKKRKDKSKSEQKSHPTTESRADLVRSDEPSAQKSATSPSQKKEAPPTGAWGGGRKPTGALSSQSSEAGANGQVASEDAASSEVDQATKAVEAATIST